MAEKHSPTYYYQLNRCVAKVALISLGLLTFFNSWGGYGSFDEGYYQQNVNLLRETGLSSVFLRNMWGPAGPLHSIIHALAYPITGGNAPGIRFLNYIFFLGALYFFAQIIKQIYPDRPYNNVWSFMAIPMTIMLAGTGLTEIPAMFFLLVSIWALFKSIDLQANQHRLLYALFGGLCLGICIAGRQTYLLVLLALPFLFLEKEIKSQAKPIALFGLAAILIPAYLFSVWGNIIPEKGSFAADGFISLNNLLLTIGTTSLVVLLISPEWFLKNRKWNFQTFAIGAVLVIILNFFLDVFNFQTAKGITDLLPGQLATLFANLAGSMVLIASFLMLLGLIQNWKDWNGKYHLFFLVATILILASSIKITHQFSIRYVFQAMPFLLILLMDFEEYTFAKAIRTGIGALIGFLILTNAFQF